MNKFLAVSLMLLVTPLASAHPQKGHGAPETVKVYKHDGSVQCDKTSGVNLDKMKEELVNAGISVSCSNKGKDGMMRPQVCGGPTGKLNVYKIPADKLVDAVDLGFKSIKSLKGYQGKRCH